MPFYADLHIHSKYSRATSRNLDFFHLALWAKKKIFGALGPGDFKRLYLALAFGSFLLGLAFAQGEVVERRPTPLWMEGAARYEISFEHREPLLMAILLVVADREVSVEVNGETVGSANDPAKASSHEITKRLRGGENRVALLSKDGAPVRVAALLELNGDLATSRWVASGPDWAAPGGKLLPGGAVDADPAANPFDPSKVADAYSSWKLAQPGEQSAATDPAGFTLPPGFRAELIRSAGADEDSCGDGLRPAGAHHHRQGEAWPVAAGSGR